MKCLFYIFELRNGSYHPTGTSCPSLEQAITHCENASIANLPMYVFELKTKTEAGKPITERY